MSRRASWDVLAVVAAGAVTRYLTDLAVGARCRVLPRG